MNFYLHSFKLIEKVVLNVFLSRRSRSIMKHAFMKNHIIGIMGLIILFLYILLLHSKPNSQHTQRRMWLISDNVIMCVTVLFQPGSDVEV